MVTYQTCLSYEVGKWRSLVLLSQKRISIIPSLRIEITAMPVHYNNSWLLFTAVLSSSTEVSAKLSTGSPLLTADLNGRNCPDAVSRWYSSVLQCNWPAFSVKICQVTEAHNPKENFCIVLFNVGHNALWQKGLETLFQKLTNLVENATNWAVRRPNYIKKTKIKFQKKMAV